MANVQVQTVTGSQFNAGTTANVYIIFKGDKGETETIQRKKRKGSHVQVVCIQVIYAGKNCIGNRSFRSHKTGFPLIQWVANAERIFLNSGERELQFQAGKTDTFLVKVGRDIGKIQNIKIGHDEMIQGMEDPDWFLEKVIITNISKKRSVMFPCNDWLSAKKGDCKVERQLAPE